MRGRANLSSLQVDARRGMVHPSSVGFADTFFRKERRK